MRYCKNCEKEVNPIKKFNWIVFILSLLLVGIGGVFYLIYYMLKRKNICPICRRRL